jgi:hypothetical protein
MRSREGIRWILFSAFVASCALAAQGCVTTWAASYDGLFEDAYVTSASVFGHGYRFAGYSVSDGEVGGWVTTVDRDGEVQWSRRIDWADSSDVFMSMKTVNFFTGDFVAAGYSGYPEGNS